MTVFGDSEGAAVETSRLQAADLSERVDMRQLLHGILPESGHLDLAVLFPQSAHCRHFQIRGYP